MSRSVIAYGFYLEEALISENRSIQKTVDFSVTE